MDRFHGGQCYALETEVRRLKSAHADETAQALILGSVYFFLAEDAYSCSEEEQQQQYHYSGWQWHLPPNVLRSAQDSYQY